MEKVFIKNRDNKNIAVLLEKPENVKGLAFLMHGLGASKDRPFLNEWAKVFKQHGYVVVRFDARDTFGESEGEYEHATVTGYYQDLEDVIHWTKAQEFYKEPFCVMGHSLGGICTALYAEAYPEDIKGLAPISTVVSGELSVEAHGVEDINQWKQSGWKERVSTTQPGLVKRLPWSHMEDRLHYNVLTHIDRLTMPVLMMVGSEDDVTPVKHQQILFDALPGKKELHVVLNAGHTFKNDEHIAETSRFLDNWLTSLK